MKRRILALTMAIMLVCVFTIGASAACLPVVRSNCDSDSARQTFSELLEYVLSSRGTGDKTTVQNLFTKLKELRSNRDNTGGSTCPTDPAPAPSPTPDPAPVDPDCPTGTCPDGTCPADSDNCTNPGTCPTDPDNCTNPGTCPTDPDNCTNPGTCPTDPTPAPGPIPTPTPDPDETPSTSENDFISEVVRLTNAERAKAGLSALKVDSTLQKAAQKRAEEQKSTFGHTRPNGSNCFTVLSEYGVSYRGAGENVAMGQSSPSAVVGAWMASEGHKANILNANYTTIGVGCYSSGGRLYWSQLFIY